MRLYPTPTRLRRLRDVAAGEVHRYGDGQDYAYGHQKITAAMAELERAGWVMLGHTPEHKRPWAITLDGALILAKAVQ